MKLSSKLAAGAGTVAVAVGIGAAILLPIGGLVAGAVVTYGAVASTMAMPAAVALSAAGAVGGLILGRIAAPIVAIGALGVGAGVGLITKAIGSGVGMVVGGFKSIFDRDSRKDAPAVDKQHMRTFERESRFDGSLAIKSSFMMAGTEPANENRKAPKPAPKLHRSFSL